jgi:hypothetical protein
LFASDGIVNRPSSPDQHLTLTAALSPMRTYSASASPLMTTKTQLFQSFAIIISLKYHHLASF